MFTETKIGVLAFMITGLIFYASAESVHKTFALSETVDLKSMEDDEGNDDDGDDEEDEDEDNMEGCAASYIEQSWYS